MLAIATSVLIALYFLFPQALFTFVFGKFVPLRTFVRSKIEELNEILLLLLFTFSLAYALVWWCPGLKSFPFGFNDNPSLRRQDYRLVINTIITEPKNEGGIEAAWKAFGRCSRRQGRLLTWYYIFIFAEAIVLGYVAKNYGRFQRVRWYRWLADTFLLPNISEWYPLLTDFTFRQKPTRIKADILCDDTLYQGTLAKHFLDKEGALSGLILIDPKRFDRRAYLLAKEAGKSPKADDYWREIPSAKLYFFAGRISNLNLNYDADKADTAILVEYLNKLLKHGMPSNKKVTVQLQEVADKHDPTTSSK